MKAAIDLSHKNLNTYQPDSKEGEGHARKHNKRPEAHDEVVNYGEVDHRVSLLILHVRAHRVDGREVAEAENEGVRPLGKGHLLWHIAEVVHLIDEGIDENPDFGHFPKKN